MRYSVLFCLVAALAPEHRVGGVPDVDLGCHATKLAVAYLKTVKTGTAEKLVISPLIEHCARPEV
jgi:hypothetical protein